MEKVIVYTALFGRKSLLKTPRIINPAFFYYVFTDWAANQIPYPWKPLPITVISQDPNRNAKQYKVLPHVFLPEHDINYWIDANFLITGHLENLLPYPHQTDVDIRVFKHFERNCLYDEAIACLHAGLDKSDIINNQINKYKQEGFPAHYNDGMFPECNNIIRKNTKEVQSFGNDWWEEIQNGSRRDQLSFMYVAWKHENNIKIEVMKQTARNNPYVQWLPHLNMNQLYDPNLYTNTK